MPIDSKKLAAMAGAVKKPAPQGRRFGVGKGDEKKGKADILEEADEEGQELGEEVDEPDPSVVLPFLEQYAEEIQACVDEVDYDLLIDPEMPLDKDSATIIQQGVMDLPPRLARLLPNFVGIEYKDAGVLAAAIVERQKADDAETWAGWIFRVGQVLAGDFEGADEAEGDDPEADDED